MRLRRILGASLGAAFALALASCRGTDAQFSIGGNISGTTGTVVLRLNGANDINMNGDGDFTFTLKLLQDATFNVQVADPTGRCTVQNGTGTVAQSNVKDVNISCADYTAFPAGLLQVVVRSTNLTGAKVNLPVTTTASGVGGIMVDPTDKDTQGNTPILGAVLLTGLTAPATRVSINQALKGNPGSNGSPIVDLIVAADGVTAVMPPNAILDTGALAALFAGELYFNVTTAANPNGELRGQIDMQGGVSASVTGLDPSLVVPPATGSNASGVGALMVDRATRKLVVCYIAHSVTGTSSAGINTTAGTGGQALAFTHLQDNFDTATGTNLATPPAGSLLPNLDDFDHSFLFFNVTSAAFPNGEIRGNISPLPQ